MPTYSYEECLQTAYRINWRIGDVIGTQQFDRARRWLPSALSGIDRISGLTEDEKTKLTHVEMGAYAHLFGYVEEFIAPQMLSLAQDFEIDNRPAFDALVNFAAEEVKHMNLFREVGARVDQAIGFPLALIGDEKAVARVVLDKNTGAVLLLTAAIEWFTQLHYLSAFKDDEGLDAFTKHIFRHHWLEEAQHAKMDHLETLRAFEGMTPTERDTAIEDLIGLVASVDGLLGQQAALDVQNLERYVGRALPEAQRHAVRTGVLQAKRYAFIESGVTHPNFQVLFGAVTTPAQQERVQGALKSLLGAGG
jgi:hypothetical protein